MLQHRCRGQAPRQQQRLFRQVLKTLRAPYASQGMMHCARPQARFWCHAKDLNCLCTTASEGNHPKPLAVLGNSCLRDIKGWHLGLFPVLIQTRRLAPHVGDTFLPLHFWQYREEHKALPLQIHILTEAGKMWLCQLCETVRDEAMKPAHLPRWVGVGGERKN